MRWTMDNGMVATSKKPEVAAPPVVDSVRRPLMRISTEPGTAPRSRTVVARFDDSTELSETSGTVARKSLRVVCPLRSIRSRS